MLPNSIRPLVCSLSACVMTLAILAGGTSVAAEVDPKQSEWYEKYKNQENIPLPDEMLLNTDAEPELAVPLVEVPEFELVLVVV